MVESMSLFNRCARRLLLLLLTTAVGPALAAVQLAAPGTSLYLADRPAKTSLPAWVASQHWFAVSLQDGALRLTPVRDTASAAWLRVQGKQADLALAGSRVAPQRSEPALALAPDALFAVRSADTGTPLLRAGQFATQTPAAILAPGWRASVSIGGVAWTMSARAQTRPDGRLLAGSLELLGQRAGDSAKVILPAATGMAFVRQELLWLGDLDGDTLPDLVVRRTRLTGDVQYVLVLGIEFSVLRIPDPRRASYFSSGVEPESNSFDWPTGSAPPAAAGLVRKGGFAIDGATWLRDLGSPPPLVPKLLAERQYTLDNEVIRFTLEYLPRAQGEASSAGDDMWLGEVVVRVFYRGKSQVLMEASAPDDGNFALSFGTRAGRPAIKIDHQPHYNNAMEYHWEFDGERFQQVLATQSQGC